METTGTQEQPATKVLVIEDDATLAFLITEALENKGFKVSTAECRAEGLQAFHLERPDLIILDRMFPDGDGLELLRELRGAGEAIPVIILTSRNEINDKVAGLTEGADDYMGKPFSIVELQARVQALLRRAGQRDPGPAETTLHGPFTLRWGQMRVERGGQALDLTPQEFRVMAALVRAQGRPLNRLDLLTQAWPSNGRPACERTVDVYLARIRSKLAGDDDHAWIQTHAGGSYSWNG